MQYKQGIEGKARKLICCLQQKSCMGWCLGNLGGGGGGVALYASLITIPVHLHVVHFSESV